MLDDVTEVFACYLNYCHILKDWIGLLMIDRWKRTHVSDIDESLSFDAFRSISYNADGLTAFSVDEAKAVLSRSDKYSADDFNFDARGFLIASQDVADALLRSAGYELVGRNI